MTILFDFTSCDPIFDKIPFEILYTPNAKLNAVLSLRNISKNVVKYKLTGSIAPNCKYCLIYVQIYVNKYKELV